MFIKPYFIKVCLCIISLWVLTACFKKKVVETIPTIKSEIIPSGTTQNINSIFVLNSDVIFLAGDSGLILKSSDAGKSWTRIKADSPSESIKKIQFFDEKNGIYSSKDSRYLQQTFDGGLTWQDFGLPYGYTAGIPPAFDILDNKYAVTMDRLGQSYITNDAGRSFKFQYYYGAGQSVISIYSIKMMNKDTVAYQTKSYITLMYNKGKNSKSFFYDPVNDFYFKNFSKAYAVGDKGYFGSSGSYERVGFNVDYPINAIDGWGSNVLAVGQNMVIGKYGEEWVSFLDSRGNSFLHEFTCVAFTSPTTCYAAGKKGILIKFYL